MIDHTNLISFYNTLFNSEIAVFGIISAVVFVFVQLLYSNYSYRHVWQVFKSPLLYLFTFLSLIDIGVTSLGSYLLSIGKHDIFTHVYLNSNNIITNNFFILSCLVLFLLSCLLFGVYIAKNISYLQPHRAIFLVLQNINYTQIRNYLWKKYKLTVPFNYTQINFIPILAALESKTKKISKQENEKLKLEGVRLKEKRTKIEKEIKNINSKIEKAEDPLSSVRDMMIQFIKKSDLNSLTESKELLVSISRKVLKDIPKFSDDNWHPEEQISVNYAEYLLEHLYTVFEIAQKDGLESAQKIILDSSHEISLMFFDASNYQALDKFFMFWQKMADKSIGKSSSIFREVIICFDDITTRTLNLLKGIDEDESRDSNWVQIENIIRYVTWLGEKLLLETSIKEEPIFYNNGLSYQTEYDSLISYLLSLEYPYSNDHPHQYPLIYFDSLSVIGEKVMLAFKKSKKTKLGENIFSLGFVYFSFAKKAIEIGNERGAALAVMDLTHHYENLKHKKLNKKAKEFLSLIVEIGTMAAGYKNKLKTVDFFSKPINEWVADKLVEYGENIDSDILEAHLKFDEGDRDARWHFIVGLGKRMYTNFGLMFDFATGELYAQGDPRRH